MAGKYDTERKTIDLVVLHHTVTDENTSWQTLSNIGKNRTYADYPHSYHHDPQTGEETFIAYHWLVWRDGRVRRCLHDDEIAWHCGDWEKNTRSIAIGFVGDYRDYTPTEAQVKACADIIRPYDKAVNGDLLVLGHKEIVSTACPSRVMESRDKIVDYVNNPPESDLKQCIQDRDKYKKWADDLGVEKDEWKSKAKDLEKRVVELEKEIKDYNYKLNECQSENSRLKKDRKSWKKKFLEVSEKKDQLSSKLDKCKRQRAGLSKDLEKAEAEYLEKEKSLKTQLASVRAKVGDKNRKIARLEREIDTEDGKISEFYQKWSGANAWQWIIEGIKKLGR